MSLKNLFFLIFVFVTTEINSQSVMDVDGNIYNTVTIGTQIWMKENLRVTHYQNGDTIPYVTDSVQWHNLHSDAYCVYNNDTSLISTYGLLYNFYTVKDSLKKISPFGWHIPTVGEWDTLINYLGGYNIAGCKMKEDGFIHWLSSNSITTNESGFTALPSGYRYTFGAFYGINSTNFIWSSYEYFVPPIITPTCAFICNLDTSCMAGANIYTYFNMGLSIRCLKDRNNPVIEPDNQLQILPNPAKGIIFVNDLNNLHMDLLIYNIIGDLVMQKELNSRTNEIDIASLATGMYIIKVIGNNWVVQKKIIKE